MTKEKLEKILSNLFEIAHKDTDNERIVFKQSSMKKENIDEYAVYQVVSDVMHNSGMSFNFSYEVANKTVDVITTLSDQYDGNWDNDDAKTESIDAIIPVYTHDLMQIYQDNSWLVDEAMSEYGTPGNDSNKNAAMGWYHAISNMVNELIPKLEELIDKPDAMNE